MSGAIFSSPRPGGKQQRRGDAFASPAVLHRTDGKHHFAMVFFFSCLHRQFQRRPAAPVVGSLRKFLVCFFLAGSWKQKTGGLPESGTAWSEAAGDPLKGYIWSLMIKSGREKPIFAQVGV